MIVREDLEFIHPNALILGKMDILLGLLQCCGIGGVKIPKGCDVHHKDTNKLNDKLNNLTVLLHSKHSKLHNKVKETKRICKKCEQGFEIKTWRLNPNRGKKGIFCSQKCYRLYRKLTKIINKGLK